MSNYLIIGDTHAPCMKPGYLDFLNDVKHMYRCTKFIHIGDLVNWNAISYHEKLVSASNALQEYKKAIIQVREIKKLFPKCVLFIGNHDALITRKSTTAGIPEVAIKPFSDLWDLDGWQIHPRFSSVVYDKVLYRHGDKGLNRFPPAYHNAREEAINLCQGHNHQSAGINFRANERPDGEGGLIWGMNVGCGIDHGKAEMEYGQKFNQKPILSCGVVEDGFYPSLIPMKFSLYT